MAKVPMLVAKTQVLHLSGRDKSVWLCGPKHEQSGPQMDLYCGKCVREALRRAKITLERGATIG